jgi:hypothetical protein
LFPIVETITIRYKKLLQPCYFICRKDFSFLERLDHGDLTENFLKTVQKVQQKELMMTFPDYYSLKDMVEKADFYSSNSTGLTVCGMVKHVGERRRPFYVKNP